MPTFDFNDLTNKAVTKRNQEVDDNVGASLLMLKEHLEGLSGSALATFTAKLVTLMADPDKLVQVALDSDGNTAQALGSGSGSADALVTQFETLCTTDRPVAEFLMDLTVRLADVQNNNPADYKMRAEAARLVLEGHSDWKVGQHGGQPVPQVWADERDIFEQFLKTVPNGTVSVVHLAETAANVAEDFGNGAMPTDPAHAMNLRDRLKDFATAAKLQLRRLS